MHAEITDVRRDLSAAFVFLLARYLGQPWPVELPMVSGVLYLPGRGAPSHTWLWST